MHDIIIIENDCRNSYIYMYVCPLYFVNICDDNSYVSFGNIYLHYYNMTNNNLYCEKAKPNPTANIRETKSLYQQPVPNKSRN